MSALTTNEEHNQVTFFYKNNTFQDTLLEKPFLCPVSSVDSVGQLQSQYQPVISEQHISWLIALYSILGGLVCSNVVQIKGHALYQGEIIEKIKKYINNFQTFFRFTIFFSTNMLV